MRKQRPAGAHQCACLRAPTAGAEYTSLEDLCKRSDVVTLHAPLLPSTFHMINAAM